MSRATKPVNPAKTAPPPAKTAFLSWKDKLMPEELEQLRNVFDLFDEDHSGTIDPEEINKIMAELGETRTGTFTFALIEGLKSKGKPINFDEFLELVCPKVGEVKTKEGIRTIFSHIDKQGDEIIDFEELKQLARISSDGCSDDDLLEMLHSIYVNRETSSNESLTFEDFYAIVSKFYKK